MKKHIHGGDVYNNRNCLDFSANCNPLGTPDSVKQAIIRSLEEVANYPQVGCGPLKEAIAAHEGVKSSYVICGNGAAELIYTICRAGKPSRALTPVPTFAEYEQALQGIGCQVRRYWMGEELALDEGFLGELTKDLDIVFLCNPNNPTGLLIDQSLMKNILDICRDKEIFLVVDECFLDFVEEGESYSLKRYLTQYPNLFLLKAFTKRYAMAGIRLGYGLTGNVGLLEQMEQVNQPWNVSTLAQAAGIAALSEQAYVQEGQALVFQEREFLKKQLDRLGLKVFDSKANYVFFQGPEDLWENCRKKGILLRDCSNYQGLSKGWYRAAVRTRQENQKLLDVMSQVL